MAAGGHGLDRWWAVSAFSSTGALTSVLRGGADLPCGDPSLDARAINQGRDIAHLGWCAADVAEATRGDAAAIADAGVTT